MPVTPFEIPEHMRDAADKSVEQAKKAFDDFIDATHQAVEKAQTSAKTLGEGAADVNRQALAVAEENVAAAFDLAQRMVKARSVEEVAVMQQEFVQRQMHKLAEQGKHLGEMVGKAASAATDKAKK